MMDAYLKIDGVPGETTAKGFEEQIEVLAFSHSVSQPAAIAASTSGGATTGRCEHADFSITKEIDKASPILAQKCSDGSHIKEILLTLVRSGGSANVPFMTYKLTNVIVANYAPGGNKGSLPTESVTFNYGKIQWEYTQQKRAGGGGGGNTAGSWNLQTNSTQ